MIAIGLRFLAGRYHATPWGRHVNEGAPEWPPSPWRLLRSLVAAWKIKAAYLNEIDVQVVLEQLAAPPSFHLPPATTGHTRHYMRWYKKGPEDQTLVFDAFVCVERESEVIVFWSDTSLGEGHRQVLERLLKEVGYLGRAESWCEARLLSDEDMRKYQKEINCRPLDGQPLADSEEIVRVLAADPDTAFDSEHVRIGKGKNKNRHVYDPAWHLCIETGQLHTEKWSDPPGSRWMRYIRRTDCFEALPRPKSRPRLEARLQVARFALDSSVLPRVTDALVVAEAARRHLMGIYGRLFTEADGSRGRSSIFSGKDAAGQPLTSHRHAYYLPTDEDGDGRLDHLTIVAADGFGRRELRAFDHFRRLKLFDRDDAMHPVQVLLVGLGNLNDYQVGPIRRSRKWVSASPFLVSRYLKKRGLKKDPAELRSCRQRFVLQVLTEELKRFCDRREDCQGFRPEEVIVTPLVDTHGVFRIPAQSEMLSPAAPAEDNPFDAAFDFGGESHRPLEFKRFRRKIGDDGGRRASGAFLITFPKEIHGPVALGHSSHFGLGLFVPA